MNNTFTIIYASQTGNAQLIAEEIADSAASFGLKSCLFCASLIDKRFSFDDIKHLVFIASTTGDGEPPETSVKLYRRLSRRTLPKTYLSHLNYALLALGDSTYIKFCKFGKELEERFQSLGAHRFYELGYADDRNKYNETVCAWIENLWPALQKTLNVKDIIIFPKSIKLPSNINNLNMSVTTNHVKNENVKTKITVPIDISIHNVLTFVKSLPQQTFKSPNLPHPYLSISYTSNILQPEENSMSENRAHLAADSGIIKARIVSAKRLTANDSSVKKTLELFIEFNDKKVDFSPGDAFGFLCSNSKDEVDFLLKRLKLSEVADKMCNITLLETRSLGKRIPSHIPTTSSLKYILSSCVDLRSIPKKLLLKILSEYSTDEHERKTLDFLSSHEGLCVFKECIQNPALCILDLLEIFPSSSPPIIRLLEHLPHLRPRFYSVASSPLVVNNMFRIVFNVIEIERYNSQIRHGICTGWLNNLTLNMQSDSIESQIMNMSINNKDYPNILIYKRISNNFHMPDDVTLPIIMIGPGTGVAPFLGFLEHREKQMSQNQETFGETWLFYGCRYKGKDYLYRNELEAFNSSGVLTHLITCFSRDEDSLKTNSPRHVQDNIILYSKQLMKILDNGGIIYVCGDEKEMSRDVWKTFIDIFQTYKDCSKEEAQSYLLKLDREKRYIVDVWS